MILSTEEHFLQPDIESISYGDNVLYHLTDDYCFEWTENGQRYRRTVFMNDLKGKLWETDLASTPDFAAILGFRHGGTSDGASILHDRGYQVFGTLKLPSFPSGELTQLNSSGQWVPIVRRWSRLQCDLLYRKMCILGQMPAWRANVEFAALRVGALSPKNGIGWYFS